MTDYLPLDHTDLYAAAGLVLFNAVLSIALRLGIARTLMIAATRMVVQLSLVGLILTWLFATESPWFTGAVAVVMLLFAGREALARQSRKFTGLWSFSIGTGTMVMAATLVTVLGLNTAIRPTPWFDPQYAIPIFGMILGNTLTGVSLGLDTLMATVVERQRGIEAQLLLGATRFKAMTPVLRRAIRTGLMPSINSMAATGVVALPGMMTGQILAGVAPAQAIHYQLLIMFLIFGGTGFGVLAAVILGTLRVTDKRHRLRLDRLRSTGT